MSYPFRDHRTVAQVDLFDHYNAALTASLRSTGETLAAMEAHQIADAAFVARWIGMTVAEAVAYSQENFA